MQSSLRFLLRCTRGFTVVTLVLTTGPFSVALFPPRTCMCNRGPLFPPFFCGLFPKSIVSKQKATRKKQPPVGAASSLGRRSNKPDQSDQVRGQDSPAKGQSPTNQWWTNRRIMNSWVDDEVAEEEVDVRMNWQTNKRMPKLHACHYWVWTQPTNRQYAIFDLSTMKTWRLCLCIGLHLHSTWLSARSGLH